MDLPSITDLATFKAGIDAVRTALGLVKDVQGVLPAGEKKDAIGRSLAFADMEIRRGEAELAKAFGYQLCQCKAPVPTPMVLAGHFSSSSFQKVQVFECPECRSNTAPYGTWTRLNGGLELTVPPGGAPNQRSGSTTTRARTTPDYF